MRASLGVLSAIAGMATLVVLADPLPPDASYRPLPTVPLDVVRKNDEAAKPAVMRRQQNLLNERYDLANRAMPGVMMSGGRKAVQAGVRVKLRAGSTRDWLAQMTPDEIKAKGLLPAGFMPLPHVKQATGNQQRAERVAEEICSRHASGRHGAFGNGEAAILGADFGFAAHEVGMRCGPGFPRF